MEMMDLHPRVTERIAVLEDMGKSFRDHASLDNSIIIFFPME